ncbi:MAG: dihydropteroate synthase [Candidatus Nealsonbacteria bacterium]|nr:dihydropteroate synthase [Candidatus Nealsonbacteria bacterium]
MQIFSERINGMYRDVRSAIKERNKEVVQAHVKEQVAGGADVIDVNIGPVKGDPVGNFVWLAQTVQEATDKTISVDSAKPKLLLEVVPKVREALPDTKLVINSSTAAADNMEKLIPLAFEQNCGIIGLCMDQEGVPGSVEKRVECGATFMMMAMEAGIAVENIYLDPIVLPVNVGAQQLPNVLEAIRQLSVVNDPPPGFIIGLSNVSTKCLKNNLLNRTYLVMCLAAGLTAAIMDAADAELVEAAVTTELLMNKHLYSDDFVKAWRIQKGI